MAHFLEHLVFKGGEKYPTYRDVNETAERMGAQLNAYTSHDLVAFHITARAEAALEAADLLSDFVGRPHIDAEELDRERGVVIQEIARANDQPAAVAEHLIDEAAMGDHPLGRPVLGPEEHLRTFTRDGDRGLPRTALGRGARRRLRGRQPRRGPLERRAGRAVLALSRPPRARGLRARPGLRAARPSCEERDSNQSHLRISYRPDVDVGDQRARAALGVYATLLGGSMGSRLFDEIREQRGLAYSGVRLRPRLRRRARAPAVGRAGVGQVRGGVRAHDARSSTSCAATGRPRPRSSARGPTPPGGSCSPSRTPTRSPATPPARRSCATRRSTPTPRSRRSTPSRSTRSADAARRISTERAVACVGPHTADEFDG